jgi:hypothetical protein
MTTSTLLFILYASAQRKQGRPCENGSTPLIGGVFMTPLPLFVVAGALAVAVVFAFIVDAAKGPSPFERPKSADRSIAIRQQDLETPPNIGGIARGLFKRKTFQIPWEIRESPLRLRQKARSPDQPTRHGWRTGKSAGRRCESAENGCSDAMKACRD